MSSVPYVLFVDDDTDVCKMFTRLFHRQLPIVQLLILHSADDALRVFSTLIPDLLITDYNMPGMNGLVLIQTLRQRGMTLPIILLSGLPDLERDAMQAGATLFLAKDKAVTDLIGIISPLLNI